MHDLHRVLFSSNTKAFLHWNISPGVKAIIVAHTPAALACHCLNHTTMTDVRKDASIFSDIYSRFVSPIHNAPLSWEIAKGVCHRSDFTCI